MSSRRAQAADATLSGFSAREGEPPPRTSGSTAAARKATGRVGSRRGFSLVELLVVIGIIAVLIGILVPTVSRVRRAAWDTSTKALLSKLQSAVERYYQDFNAYPGPLVDSRSLAGSGPYVGGDPGLLSRVQVAPAGFDLSEFNSTTAPPAATPTTWTTGITFNSITGTNNLVLALLGGLYLDTSGAAGPIVRYDPSLVGKGPASLNAANLKSYPAYVDESDLSWRSTASGKTGSIRYSEIVGANDSAIPAFLDRYPDRMPILYLRAKVGTRAVARYGNVAVSTTSPDAQFDLAHVLGYTSVGRMGLTNVSVAGASNAASSRGRHGLSFLGTNASWNKTTTPGQTYYYPYDLSIYLSDPRQSAPPLFTGDTAPRYVARSKDKYVLIAAGSDRIYGTNDDATTFGEVAP